MRRAVLFPLLAVLAAACSTRSGDGSPTTLEATTTAAVAEAVATTTTLPPNAVVFTPGEDALVLGRGAQGEWDSGVMRFPSVILHNGTFHLFYEARAQPGESDLAIGWATSEDGLMWTKHEANPVLAGDGDGFDARAVGRPVVAVDDDGIWVMFYAGVDVNNGSAIGRATASSPTGPWVRDEEAALVAGQEGAWDHGLIQPDQVIEVGGMLHLYYSGRDRDGGVAMIGLATSEDGLSWEKHNDPANDASDERFAESDPVLINDQPWDSRATWTPTVWPHNDGLAMVYNGFGSLGAAVSADGVHWEKYEANPVHRAPALFHPALLSSGDNSWWIYYRHVDDEAIHRLEATLAIP